MKPLVVFVALFLICSILTTVPAYGTIVYTTFGSGDSYSTSAGFACKGSGYSTQSALAMKFQINGQSCTLDSMELALASNTSLATLFEVKLAADNAGTPGAVLNSAQVNAPLSAAIVTADFANSTLLQTQTNYWMCLFPKDPKSYCVWRSSSPAVSGKYAYSNDTGQNWNVLSTSHIAAFRVNAIPEPATIVLFGLGFLALVKKRRA